MKHSVVLAGLFFLFNFSAAQECEGGCPRYLFVVASDEDVIEAFAEAINNSNEFRLVEFNRRLSSGLSNMDGVGENIAKQVPEFFFPLYFEASGVQNLTNNFQQNGIEDIQSRPCDGMLAIVEDLNNRRSPKEVQQAISALNDLKKSIPQNYGDVVFGPNPQTSTRPKDGSGLREVDVETMLGSQTAPRQNGDFGEGVTIAVVDTGINLEEAGLPVDSGQRHFDFVEPFDPNTPFDNYSFRDASGQIRTNHGTPIAALAARQAPSAAIMSVRVCGSDDDNDADDCLLSNVVLGVCFAIKNSSNDEADSSQLVINLSLGGPDSPSILKAVLDQAISRGALIAASGGYIEPDGEKPPTYPADFSAPDGFDGLVAVTALNETGNDYYERSFVSPSVDVAANGVNQLGYTGTSFATAHVTGVLAAILGNTRAAEAREVEECLWNIAANTNVLPDGPSFGVGVVQLDLPVIDEMREHCPNLGGP